MKVGLSLSLCVQDIIEGKVKLEDVKFLSTGTMCRTKKHWDEVIEVYQELYWASNKEKGAEIAWHFILGGMIIQPRLEGKIPVARANGRLGRWEQHWISESEYTAMDQTVNMTKREKELSL